MELQCELQTKYIGTPMLHYCPMTKLEKRLEELEVILDGVSSQFQTFKNKIKKQQFIGFRLLIGSDEGILA